MSYMMPVYRDRLGGDDDAWSLVETREDMEAVVQVLANECRLGWLSYKEMMTRVSSMNKAVIKHEQQKAVDDTVSRKLAAKVTPLNEDFDFAF